MIFPVNTHQILLYLTLLMLLAFRYDAWAQTVRLKATADIWLSDTNEQERNSSAGKARQFKLKSIQEMAAIRFDADPVKGKIIESATLFLRPRGSDDQLRHIRVSTIGQTWEEGTSTRAYGPPSGATFRYADAAIQKHWSHPYSQFADVTMGSGNTITTYNEIERLGDGWIGIGLTPELIYAMANGITDGLSIMEGGNLAYFNHFIFSRESARGKPFIEVVLAGEDRRIPAKPIVSATANYEKAGLDSGTISVSIKSAKDTFAWNVYVDGQPVERWQIPFPFHVQRTGTEQDHLTGRPPAPENVTFHLRGLPSDQPLQLEVEAIGIGGATSSRATVDVEASPRRRGTPSAVAVRAPSGTVAPHSLGANLVVWAVPGLVKIDPISSQTMHPDMIGKGDGNTSNAVWDGSEVSLHGAKGEYLSFQLVVARKDSRRAIDGIQVTPGVLRNGDSYIGRTEFELFKNWYSTSATSRRWYPAFNIPMQSGDTFAIPDPKRGIKAQANQTILVDIYIPKNARPGIHRGSIQVSRGDATLYLPLSVQVYDFALPDTLNFYVEFNAYRVPKNHLHYHRLAHQHRGVFNPCCYRPRVEGVGKNLQLDWTRYDSIVGPLLSGEAFKHNRRSGVPTPVMYLPFIDNWPVNLTREHYHYDGPWVHLRGNQLAGNKQINPQYKAAKLQLNEHYRTSPYIGDALQASYVEGEAAAIRQFVQHFREQGWRQTEMHYFYGGKKTHRINYGNNQMWWQTDEPYHWEDWQALQFFNNLWTQTIRGIDADPNIWMGRGDISRPNWQGKVMDGVMQVQYGGFSDMTRNLRLRWLRENTGVITRDYGGLGNPMMSYTQASANVLNLWLSGASGFLPWQTLGGSRSLDKNTTTTLFVDGERFNTPVVADMRLKAFRQGQQIIEYAVLLAERKKLSRQQVRAFITQFFPVGLVNTGSNVDNADSKKSTTFVSWEFSALKKQMARLISEP